MAKQKSNNTERTFLVSKYDRQHAEAAVRACIDADVPVLLWGEPGTGKSAWLEAEAARRGWHCEVVALADYALEDLVGPQVPQPDGTVKHLMPPFLESLWNAHKEGKGTMLFLDELSCATSEKHALGLRMLSARYVGPHPLPPGCRVVAAANPADLAAGGADLPPPTANRVEHIWWDPMDIERWSNNVLTGKWTPIRDEHDRRARALVTAFLRSVVGREWFQRCPTDPAEQGGPWPSQRAWTVLAENLLPACLRMGMRIGQRDGACSEPVQAIIEGQVGPSAAAAFQDWLMENDIPTPQEILSGKAKMPLRDDLFYAAAVSLASYVAERSEEEMVQKCYSIFEKHAQKKPEVVLVAIRELIEARKKGKHSVDLPDSLRKQLAKFLKHVL